VAFKKNSSSDSGRSKSLLKSAGPSHSVSIHQKKAFGELYSMVMVGGCELKVYRSYAHFQFFLHKFQLNDNTKVLNQFTQRFLREEEPLGHIMV